MRIVIKGIPSNAGALYPGTELAPEALRKAGIVKELGLTHEVNDLGDVKLPENLVRHNKAPIRNWPSPHIVWQESINQLEACFEESDFAIVMGGSCSVFTGVFSKFHQIYGTNAKIITLDHHIDIKEPDNEVCMGASANTHWFLTTDNKWFERPAGFTREGITALGYNNETIVDGYDVAGIYGYSKDEIPEIGIDKVLRDCFDRYDKEDRILVHLDLDVIGKSDLESVYSPSDSGLSILVVEEILKGITLDPRVSGIVITEFSGANLNNERDAAKLVNLLGRVFNSKD